MLLRVPVGILLGGGHPPGVSSAQAEPRIAAQTYPHVPPVFTEQTDILAHTHFTEEAGDPRRVRAGRDLAARLVAAPGARPSPSPPGPGAPAAPRGGLARASPPPEYRISC